MAPEKAILYNEQQNIEQAIELKMGNFVDRQLIWRSQFANNVKARELCGISKS